MILSLRHIVYLSLCLFLMFFLFNLPAFAQEGILDISQEASVLNEGEVELVSLISRSREEEIMESVRQEMILSYQDDIVVRPNVSSLLFLPNEHSLLQAAKTSFLTRLPTNAELNSEDDDAIVTSVRDLSLGGIVYADKEKWIIWINSQRITPEAIPPEILDISVFKDYVNVKWFDRQTNRVYPIRLRPNQRFNLDARMFLPG